MFAGVYEDARKRNDTDLQQKLTQEYVLEQHHVRLYGRAIQKNTRIRTQGICLIHANQLEADHIGELLDLFRKRGYRFITLEDALGDQAYGMPDSYVGEEAPAGSITGRSIQGKPPQGMPRFPQWVIRSRDFYISRNLEQ